MNTTKDHLWNNLGSYVWQFLTPVDQVRVAATNKHFKSLAPANVKCHICNNPAVQVSESKTAALNDLPLCEICTYCEQCNSPIDDGDIFYCNWHEHIEKTFCYECCITCDNCNEHSCHEHIYYLTSERKLCQHCQ